MDELKEKLRQRVDAFNAYMRANGFDNLMMPQNILARFSQELARLKTAEDRQALLQAWLQRLGTSEHVVRAELAHGA